MEAPTDGFVNRTQAGFMIARDDQLELRAKLEKITAHESCGNLVAAGHRLDLRFSPPDPVLGFGCSYKSGAA
jgi:hypothetical protein